MPVIVLIIFALGAQVANAIHTFPSTNEASFVGGGTGGGTGGGGNGGAVPVLGEPKTTVYKVTVDITKDPPNATDFQTWAEKKFGEFKAFLDTQEDLNVTSWPTTFKDESPRTVMFLDTKNADFKGQHYILRYRSGAAASDEDFTFKRRSNGFDTASQAKYMQVQNDVKANSKVKVQWVAGQQDPAVAIYGQVKAKDMEELKKKIPAFPNATVETYAGAFPGMQLMPAFSASWATLKDKQVSPNGLEILQRELSTATKISLNCLGGNIEFSPSVILWYKQTNGKADGLAFSGELTWDTKWKTKTPELAHFCMKNVIFDKINTNKPDFLGSGSKTAAAYNMMVNMDITKKGNQSLQQASVREEPYSSLVDG